MNTSHTLTLETGGKVTLPDTFLQRYGLAEAARVRVVETQKGLLLVPLTHEPMNPELAAELQAWQELGATSWETFPFEEDVL